MFYHLVSPSLVSPSCPSPQALNTLLELIQGPCHDNQVALVRSSFLSVTQRMLDSLHCREEQQQDGRPPLRFPPPSSRR